MGYLRWKLRNGCSVKFWRDCWLPESIKLEDEKIEEIPSNLIDLKIVHLVKEDGKWDVEKFAPYFRLELVKKIVSQIRVTYEDDIPIWPHTSWRLFSM